MLKRLSASFQQHTSGSGSSSSGGHSPQHSDYRPSPLLSSSYGGRISSETRYSDYGNDGSYGRAQSADGARYAVPAGPGFLEPSPSSSGRMLSPALSTPVRMSSGHSPRLSTSGGGGYFSSEVSSSVSPMHSPQGSPRLPSNSRTLSASPSAVSLANLIDPSDMQLPHDPTHPPPTAADRAALQKSLKAMEVMLVTLDEYRDLRHKLAKIEKRLSKNGRDLAQALSAGNAEVAGKKGKQRSGQARGGAAPPSIVDTLQQTALYFDAVAEVSGKSAKYTQREYDRINDHCSSYFKRIAKEERNAEQRLFDLDVKMKEANFAYEQSIRIESHRQLYNGERLPLGNSVAGHHQYMPVLAQLANEMDYARASYGQTATALRDAAARDVAYTVATVCDTAFRGDCETLQRSGMHIGGLLAAQALLGQVSEKDASNMPPEWPEELREDMSEPTRFADPLEYEGDLQAYATDFRQLNMQQERMQATPAVNDNDTHFREVQSARHRDYDATVRARPPSNRSSVVNPLDYGLHSKGLDSMPDHAFTASQPVNKTPDSYAGLKLDTQAGRPGALRNTQPVVDRPLTTSQRTTSSDSTGSAGSIVQTMRARYTESPKTDQDQSNSKTLPSPPPISSSAARPGLRAPASADDDEYGKTIKGSFQAARVFSRSSEVGS